MVVSITTKNCCDEVELNINRQHIKHIFEHTHTHFDKKKPLQFQSSFTKEFQLQSCVYSECVAAAQFKPIDDYMRLYSSAFQSIAIQQVKWKKEITKIVKEMHTGAPPLLVTVPTAKNNEQRVQHYRVCVRSQWLECTQINKHKRFPSMCVQTTSIDHFSLLFFFYLYLSVSIFINVLRHRIRIRIRIMVILYVDSSKTVCANNRTLDFIFMRFFCAIFSLYATD